MKVIMQHDERDCGAACLAMIAEYYGRKDSLNVFRELTKTDRNGTNIFGLIDGAKKIGLEAKALFGSLVDLIEQVKKHEIEFPFIAHIINENGLQHYIVVLSLYGNKIKYIDPSKGRQHCSFDYFKNIWDGYIVVFNKTTDFEPGCFRKTNFSKFIHLVRGQYKHFIVTLVTSILIAFIGIVGAFIFQSVINNFYSEQSECTEHEHSETDSLIDEGLIHNHDDEADLNDESANILDRLLEAVTGNANNFNDFFLLLIGLYILQGMLQFLRGCILAKLSKNIDLKIVLSYFNNIVDMPMETIETRNTGEYLSRFSDASVIRDAVSGVTVALTFDTIMTIGSGVILYLQNKGMFMVSLLTVVVYLIVIFIYKNPIKKMNKNVMSTNANVESFLKETVDGAVTIKANCMEGKIQDINSNKFTKLVNIMFKRNVITVSQDSLCDTVQQIGIVLILWTGFIMVLKNTIGIGELITFYVLLTYFITPIKNLTELQPQIQAAKVAAERLEDISGSTKETNNKKMTKITDINHIGFSHVSFRYGNADYTLSDISFSINKGEKIAIIGESGCGKTTIAKLLMGLYEPESGNIFYNNKNSKELSIKDMRKIMSYVEQDGVLFFDTIRNNIIAGKANVTDEEIMEVCRKIHVDYFVEDQALGLDTILSENGNNLSNGQRQKIALLRALVKKPQLLILDEATSGIDKKNEDIILQEIFSISDLTCIMISHSLSNIKRCDRIIALDEGRVAETGTFEELMQQEGICRKMFDRNFH